jgi:hypothetical protein
MGGCRRRLGGLECHAREADTAGPPIIQRLIVSEQPALGRADGVQEGIGRREAADAPLIPHRAGRPEPSLGIAGRGSIQHRAVELPHLFLEDRVPRPGAGPR